MDSITCAAFQYSEYYNKAATSAFILSPVLACHEYCSYSKKPFMYIKSKLSVQCILGPGKHWIVEDQESSEVSHCHSVTCMLLA